MKLRNNCHSQTKTTSFAILTLILLLSCAHSIAQVNAPKRVLVLFSYDAEYPGNRSILSSLRKNLPEEIGELKVEYIDFKHIANHATLINQYAPWLKEKLSSEPNFDIIITVGDPALTLASHSTFNDISKAPIVFLAVQDAYHAKIQDQNSSVTGIIEQVSPLENIALIEQIFPAASRLLIITDSQPESQALSKDLLNSIRNPLKSKTTLWDLSQLTWNELAQRLQNTGKNDVILMVSATIDTHGITKPFEQAIHFIQSKTKSPMLSFWAHEIGLGPLGGYVTSRSAQAKLASEIATHFLHYDSLDPFLVSYSQSYFHFDATALKRFDIHRSKLPNLSTLTNQPFSIFNRYSLELTIFLALALLWITISTFQQFALIRQRRKISQLELKTRNLKLRENHINAATHAAGIGIWELNVPTGNIHWNHTMFDLHHQHQSSFKPTIESWIQLIHMDDRQLAYENLHNSMHTGEEIQVKFWLETNNSEHKLLINLTGTAEKDKDNNVLNILGTAFDVTKANEMEENIRYQANHDMLTNLPNKNQFASVLSNQIQHHTFKKGKLAVVYIDLDHFKSINDSLGHSSGDRILQIITSRIIQNCGTKDFIARNGGDEFSVIFPNIINDKDATSQAKKLLADITQPIPLGNEIIYISASAGLVIYPDSATTSDQLIAYANQAVNLAKKDGRNCIRLFQPNISTNIAQRHNLHVELYEAIQNNQIQLAFQPIIKIDTMKIISAEALLRWYHQEHGWIAPSIFIGLAKDTGIINYLSELSLKASLHALQSWHDLGFKHMGVNINKSSHQLMQNRDEFDWLDVIQHHPVDSSSVTIEVSENTILDQRKIVVQQLSALKEAGVNISIDDFGAGYSTVCRLKNLNVDSVKIDRAFFRNIEFNKADEPLIRNIISEAKTLDVDIIAGGIETKLQHDFAQTLNCHFSQGYYYAHPMLAEQFYNTLKENGDTLNLANTSNKKAS